MSDFEFDRPKRGVNLHGSAGCVVCGGDRFVVVCTRPAKQTIWMEARKITPVVAEGFEEYAPCPSCHAGVDTEFFRCDGTKARALDLARVREMMRR